MRDSPADEKTSSLGMMKLGKDLNGYLLQQSQNGHGGCS